MFWIMKTYITTFQRGQTHNNKCELHLECVKMLCLNSCHDRILFSISSRKAGKMWLVAEMFSEFFMLVLMREIFRISSFRHLPFVLSHIFTLSLPLLLFFLRRTSLGVILLAQILSYSPSHTHLSPLSLFINPFFCGPSAAVGETCFGGERYPDTFWMCLWTRRGQSQWCMAVIPILQRDTAVSCHGRQDDLYSAALLMAWYKWC